MEQSSLCLHVVVVGGGLCGLVAAIGLQIAGHTVTVVEQTAQLRELGAGIQIPANSAKVLHKLGLLEEVEKLSVEPLELCIRSYRGEELHRQNLYPYIQNRFHFPHLLIHRADLRRIFHDRAVKLGARIMLGARVSRVKFETSEVELISGQRLKGDLILGADGENSVCREWLLSQANSPRSSGDIVYRLAIPASRISSNPSIATLVDPPRVFAWFGPKSHAVCYPLQKDGIINVVLTFPESEGTAVIGPQPGDLGTIRNLCKEWDPQFQQLLGEAESTLKWTLLEPQYLKQWSHHLGKFILIGDSAHATLPYLAQGAALALESAYILSVLLQHITNLEQLPRILALFEKSRIPRSVRTREYSKYLHDMCQLVDGPAQMERDRIFREEQPGKGFPNPWSDLEFQEFAWDFDATAEADRIWKKMNGGRESV